MELNFFFHALAMLCGLASVTFAALDCRPRAWAAVAVGFMLGALAVPPDRLPDPVWIGGAVAALSAAALMRPRTWTLVAVGGGLLAGIYVALLQAAGTPLAWAVLLAALPVAASAALTRRQPLFAPVALRDEALLMIMVLGVAVAIAPGVVAGWQSAGVLNLETQEVASQAVPAWTLLPTLGAAALGGLYTVWMRR